MANSFSFLDQVVHVGDTVRVQQRIQEGAKSRLQTFEGVVIGIRGSKNGKTFVVRKIGTGGIGIEKIMPVHMPSLEKIEVKRQGDVKRAKLNYLRGRIGKAASKVKEKATVYEAAA